MLGEQTDRQIGLLCLPAGWKGVQGIVKIALNGHKVINYSTPLVYIPFVVSRMQHTPLQSSHTQM